MVSRLLTAIEHRRRIRRAVEYLASRLQACPDDWPSLVTLGEVACMSPYHFIRRYQHAVGETPQQTVRRLKLQAAHRQLAARPSATVADVAAWHGYESAAAFARAYRRCFGDVPSRRAAVAASVSPPVASWTAVLPPIRLQAVPLSREPGAVGATFDELMGHLDVAGVPRFGQDMFCELSPDGDYRRACAVDNRWVAGILRLAPDTHRGGLHRCLSGQPDAVWQRWREDGAVAAGRGDAPLLLRYLNDPAYRAREEQRIELYVPL